MAGFLFPSLFTLNPIQGIFRQSPNYFLAPKSPRKFGMAVPEVYIKLLGELEAMGFPLAQATKALHYSGSSSLEAAIDWIIDHENDPEIDQLPLVPVNIDIEDSSHFSVTEQVFRKAQELRERARKRTEKEDVTLEREHKKERVQVGKELLEAKRIEEENERRRLLALRKAEKEEENKARDRVRQKLLQDKVERRQRLGLPPQDPASVKPTMLTPAMHKKLDSLRTISPGTLVKSSAKAELMTNCLRSLRRKCNHMDEDAKAKVAFQTLLSYVRNVARDPDNEKFRKIRTSNPAFKDRVGAFEEGIKFLELCGFERVERGRFLYLSRDKVDMAELILAATQLQSAMSNPFFGLVSK